MDYSKLEAIAFDALLEVQHAYRDYVAVNGTDEDCDLYLFVYKSGYWCVDDPQCLTNHRGIVTQAPVAPYTSTDDLLATLVANQAWECD